MFSQPTLSTSKFFIIIGIVAALFLVPISVMCGAPGQTCVTAPDAQGRYSHFYVYEPLGVWVLEMLLGTDIEFHYLRTEQTSQLPPDALPLPTAPLIGVPEPALPGGPGAVACTMDAKVCPDGSAVGRSGPNCEFAPCPGEDK